MIAALLQARALRVGLNKYKYVWTIFEIWTNGKRAQHSWTHCGALVPVSGPVLVCLPSFTAHRQIWNGREQARSREGMRRCGVECFKSYIIIITSRPIDHKFTLRTHTPIYILVHITYSGSLPSTTMHGRDAVSATHRDPSSHNRAGETTRAQAHTCVPHNPFVWPQK